MFHDWPGKDEFMKPKEPYPPPCVHGDGTNLCPDCQATYDEDPTAYLEYGNHPKGIENWARLQEELAADANTHPPDESSPGEDVPF